MSRQPRSGAAGVVSVPVTVKASPAERDAWAAAAARAGKTMSDWLRQIANRAAERSKGQL